MTERIGSTSLDVVYDSVNALLAARRPDDALEIVRQLAAETPDSFDVYFLAGLCHISARRVSSAEDCWRRAAAMNPDHVGCAILGVRSALSGPPKQLETAWERADRLRPMAPGVVQARFWIALAAARTKRTEIALAEVAEVSRLDPGGNWPLYAAAEVDLALSARANRSRRPRVAESAVRELLSRDPQDVWAHELRDRTASYDLVSALRRRVAEVRLGYTRDAARAGVIPKPGRLKQLTWEAARPARLAFLWFAVAFFGAVLLSSLGLVPTIVLLSCVGVALCISAWRRAPRVLLQLPPLTRTRFVGSILTAMYVAAAVVAVAAASALLILAPFTRARAEHLNFGKQKSRTETIIIFDTVPTFPPLPTFDLPDLPSIPGALGSPNFPNIPTIPDLPGSSTRIPDIRTVRVGDGVDKELSWDLMHYWMFAAISSLLVAGVLMARAATLRSATA